MNATIELEEEEYGLTLEDEVDWDLCEASATVQGVEDRVLLDTSWWAMAKKKDPTLEERYQRGERECRNYLFLPATADDWLYACVHWNECEVKGRYGIKLASQITPDDMTMADVERWEEAVEWRKKKVAEWRSSQVVTYPMSHDSSKVQEAWENGKLVQGSPYAALPLDTAYYQLIEEVKHPFYKVEIREKKADTVQCTFSLHCRNSVLNQSRVEGINPMIIPFNDPCVVLSTVTDGKQTIVISEKLRHSQKDDAVMFLQQTRNSQFKPGLTECVAECGQKFCVIDSEGGMYRQGTSIEPFTPMMAISVFENYRYKYTDVYAERHNIALYEKQHIIARKKCRDSILSEQVIRQWSLEGRDEWIQAIENYAKQGYNIFAKGLALEYEILKHYYDTRDLLVSVVRRGIQGEVGMSVELRLVKQSIILREIGGSSYNSLCHAYHCVMGDAQAIYRRTYVPGKSNHHPAQECFVFGQHLIKNSGEWHRAVHRRAKQSCDSLMQLYSEIKEDFKWTLYEEGCARCNSQRVSLAVEAGIAECTRPAEEISLTIRGSVGTLIVHGASIDIQVPHIEWPAALYVSSKDVELENSGYLRRIWLQGPGIRLMLSDAPDSVLEATRLGMVTIYPILITGDLIKVVVESGDSNSSNQEPES